MDWPVSGVSPSQSNTRLGKEIDHYRIEKP